jgi:hypothetical protein
VVAGDRSDQGEIDDVIKRRARITGAVSIAARGLLQVNRFFTRENTVLSRVCRDL